MAERVVIQVDGVTVYDDTPVTPVVLDVDIDDDTEVRIETFPPEPVVSDGDWTIQINDEMEVIIQ
jgi:hypothetical protein